MFASLVKAWECPVATAVEGFGTEDTPVTSNTEAFEVPFRRTAEIRIRAERQVGELIAAQEKAVGLNQGALKGKTGDGRGPGRLWILGKSGSGLGSFPELLAGR